MQKALTQQTAVSTTSETTIVSAASGFRNQLIGLVITTTNAAAATLTLRDGTAGTVKAVLNYPNAAAAPSVPLVIQFPVPLAQAAWNTNWTLTASANASGFNVTALYTLDT